jgi:hypothetical protein
MGKPVALLLLALGGLVTSLAGSTLWATWKNLSGGPRPFSVAAAPVEEWVTLTGATIRCETRKVSGRSAYYEATADDGSETFLVQAGEELPCAGLVLEGGFSKDRLSQETIRTRLGVEPPALPAVRIFSVLNAEFLKHALWYSGPMFLLGVATLAFGVRRYRAAG